jgi:transposase
MVNKEGFPVSYEIFEGNIFEGDTFIPSILEFKNKHKVKKLTIVADAAMISFENVQKLIEHNLSYIVGARMGNLSSGVIEKISTTLNGTDGKTGRMKTDKGTLIFEFSQKRYRKDKREMEKQIRKAELLVEENTEGRRTKFLMLKKSENKKEKVYELNNDLIKKTKLLLGIKGYYTNLSQKKANDKTVIDHYHNLWHVEKAFRIAKSDLQMRPVFASTKPAIEAHALICFMALAACRCMEHKTGKSTKKIVKLLKSITEARMKNLDTGEIFTMKQKLSPEVERLRQDLES